MPFVKPLPLKGFYAVIFSNSKNGDLTGYAEMDDLTMAEVVKQNGYLGYESLSNANKTIFISYWETMDAITAWSKNSTHLMAKAEAEKWYSRYLAQICFVERSHLFEK